VLNVAVTVQLHKDLIRVIRTLLWKSWSIDH